MAEKSFAISQEDDDDDPILDDLRVLDYRYIRFAFHPLKDRFLQTNSWIDPAWTDVKTIRAGIDGDEKEKREQAFGNNLIDIRQKSIPQLLVDEVCYYAHSALQPLISIGFPPILRISNSESHSLVGR